MAATTEPIVDAQAAAAANANAASDASKKKKSKKTIADNSKYTDIETVMPVKLKASHAKGRHIVASENLKAGTLVAVEKAAASIVRNTSFVSICHHCSRPVTMQTQTRPKLDEHGKPVPDQVERFSTPTHSCTKCKMAAYCSEACHKAHQVQHEVQCAALAESNAIAAAHQVPLEHLRAVLALIGRRAADIKANVDGKPQFTANVDNLQPTPYSSVLDMNPNRHYLERKALTNAQAALKAVLALVPEEARVPISEAVELLCIFNSNQFFLTVNNHHVLSLYPVTSLFFHHSCSPNCVFVGETNGTLFVRTLADVPAEQELTISFVDLYQPREQRRRELLLSRHFWCKCKRCSTLLSQSVDRFMDGIMCNKCNDGVMIFEETKEVQDINELMTDISALDKEIQGKFAVCEACNAQLEVTKLVDVLKKAITDYGMAYGVWKQQNNLERARLDMERFIKEHEEKHVLSIYNSYLINTYANLMEICAAQGDIDRAIRYNSVIAQRMRDLTNAVPENYPALAEINIKLGDRCLKQARAKANNKTPVGRNTTKKYLKEAVESLGAASRANAVVYGENSVRAVEAKRLFEAAKKDLEEYNKSLEKKPKKKQAPTPAPAAAPAVAPAVAAPAAPAAPAAESTSA
ncbi:hypothetical protein GGI07_005667 [Coemansia sp. Benny D115]|nr:hypothetical protein GGI07_005667 [Coemansia sp. Benny D115]